MPDCVVSWLQAPVFGPFPSPPKRRGLERSGNQTGPHYLASAATSTEMQARSAEIAELMVSADTVNQGSRVLLYRYLRNIVLLGGFNVVAVGIGLWMGQSRMEV
jgi:hypothetical protein